MVDVDLQGVIAGVAFRIPEESVGHERRGTSSHGNVLSSLRHTALERLTNRHTGRGGAASLAAGRIRADLGRDAVWIDTDELVVSMRPDVGHSQARVAIQLLFDGEVPL